MQSENRFFDDLAKMVTGVASAALLALGAGLAAMLKNGPR